MDQEPRLKTIWILGIGIAAGLLGAGIILLVSRAPRGSPIALLPPPTIPPLTVHIDGAVASPGVYMLGQGSRLQDAILAAGGVLSTAEMASLNLAAPLVDGEKIVIPTQPPAGTATTIPTVQPASRFAFPTEVPQTPLTLVNINTATQAELESLPGIGPKLAKEILNHRQLHGPFTSIEQIVDVKGIGPATYDRIRNLITVGGS